jgi:hypothetical protein
VNVKRAIVAPIVVATTLSLVALTWRYDAFGLTGSNRPAPPAVHSRGDSHGSHSGPPRSNPKPGPKPSIKDGIAIFNRTATLTAVAEACASTSNDQQAGAVVLKQGLRQQRARVRFTVPCAIQLDGSANVRLEDMHVTSQTLNFSDTAVGAGRNVFDIQRTKWTGSPEAGLLIEFSDPNDRIQVGWSWLTYPLGISFQARGDRTLPDRGGIVRLYKARLSSHGDASEGIVVTASTHKGSVKAKHSLFDAEQIGIVADRCTVGLKGRPVDCRASTLADDLKEQAAAAAAEQAAAEQ